MIAQASIDARRRLSTGSLPVSFGAQKIPPRARVAYAPQLRGGARCVAEDETSAIGVKRGWEVQAPGSEVFKSLARSVSAQCEDGRDIERISQCFADAHGAKMAFRIILGVVVAVFFGDCVWGIGQE